MLIGIDASRTNQIQPTGVERYSKEIIRHLLEIDKQDNFILYTNKKFPTQVNDQNSTWKVIPLRRVWTQVRLTLELFLGKRKPDVLFIPSHVPPLLCPVNYVVTIHDVAWKNFPESYSKFQLFYLDWMTRRIIKKARHVIVPSKATKQDLIKFFGADINKITVVYHGIRIANQKTLQPASLGFPYILYTGRIELKKNLPKLLEAFALLKNERLTEHKLLLVGKPGHGYEKIKQVIAGLPINVRQAVVETGYLSDKNIYSLMLGADIYVAPSQFEGFGLPVLEAMELGCPVVATEAGALPEVVGEAGILVNPDSILGFAAAMSKIIHLPMLRRSLIIKGKRQAGLFSWQAAAEQTLKVLHYAKQ